MKNGSLGSQKSGSEKIRISDLSRHASIWLMSGDIANHSPKTIALRRIITDKLLWFLRQREFIECGLDELRFFFHYLNHGHEQPGGRWGNPQNTKQVSARTVRDYHGHLCTFFRWMVVEDALDASPMERIPVPISRADQVVPFTEEQIQKLLAAARRTHNPKRDEAIVMMLYDCGLRAAELCGMRMVDLDLQSRRCTVLGKGNKRRMIPMGKQTIKVLFNYIKSEPSLDEDGPVFRADRAGKAGDALTTSGLLRLIYRLGKAAKVSGAHPHKFRHSFAVAFLRSGANQYTLMEILGHTNPKMTARYVQLAQADIEAQHRLFSPGDRLKGGVR